MNIIWIKYIDKLPENSDKLYLAKHKNYSGLYILEGRQLINIATEFSTEDKYQYTECTLDKYMWVSRNMTK